jgi:hypothetical protein
MISPNNPAEQMKEEAESGAVATCNLVFCYKVKWNDRSRSKFE